MICYLLFRCLPSSLRNNLEGTLLETYIFKCSRFSLIFLSHTLRSNFTDTVSFLYCLCLIAYFLLHVTERTEALDMTATQQQEYRGKRLPCICNESPGKSNSNICNNNCFGQLLGYEEQIYNTCKCLC